MSSLNNPLGVVNVGGKLAGQVWVDTEGKPVVTGQALGAGQYQSDLTRLNTDPNQLRQMGALAASTQQLGMMQPVPQVQADAVNAASVGSSGFNKAMGADRALNA